MTQRRTIQNGSRFGRLTVVRELPTQLVGKSKVRTRMFLVRCDCGKEKAVRGISLTSGNTTSCGCLHKELLAKRNQKHGDSSTRLFRIWKAMIARCKYDTPRNRRYCGRGIFVCAEWKTDFAAFRDWALAHGYSDSLSIDRIDVDGNYEPSNCHWIPMSEQTLNISTNRRITAFGKTQTLAEWSRETGIDRRLIGNRIDRLHWTPEMALTNKKGKQQ